MTTGMAPETPHPLIILKEACEQLGYKWHMIDPHSNNLVEVTDGTKRFFAGNGKIGLYPLNPKFSGQLVKDKAWSYLVLKGLGYRIPQGDYFFLQDIYKSFRNEGREWADAVTFAKDKYPVFVKPNGSSLGILAEVIHDQDELVAHLRQIAEISYIALIQEYISLPEYRIFAVDGQIEFAYERFAPCIEGDGKQNIKEHLELMNKNISHERNKISAKSPFLHRQLQRFNLTIDSVLKQGQRLKVSSKANISAGGTINNYTELFSPKTQHWVRTLMQDLSLRVCGIDVFVKDSLEDPTGFTLIEINHNPNLSGIYHLGHRAKAMAIWEKILTTYFIDHDRDTERNLREISTK